MEIGIIGLPQSGKSTVFNALTAGHAASSGAAGTATEIHIGVVKVPDPRLDRLAEIYHPRKVVQAEIKFWDLPGIGLTSQSQGYGGQRRNILQTADAFLLVVRAFTNPAVAHPRGSVDPGRDLDTVLGELAFADLEVMDRAVQRLEEGLKKAPVAERPTLTRQLEAASKIRESLEQGVPVRRLHLSDSEAGFLADYQLLTVKPVIAVFNTDESGPDRAISELGLDPERTTGLSEVSLPARLEADLALMSDEEQAEFRRDLGLGEPAISRVIDVSYRATGLVSFLTVGEDEVRAWSVADGLPAQDAAGTIHTDFFRGFIRAEVIPYQDLVRCGSVAQGRKEGVLRSEGKTYRVRDGDVINFLVNV